MKKAYSNPWFYFRLALVIVMVIAIAAFYNDLPDPLPIHWNLEGEIDEWGQKRLHAWLMPLIALVITLFFPILPKIDPRKRNYENFSGVWERLQTAIVLFFAYIQGVILYMILVPDQSRSMTFWMQIGIGVLFVLIGNWMGKIRSNYFVGLRTPWALEDPEVWQKSQRVAGWSFVVGGLIFVLQSTFEWQGLWVFGVTIGLMVLVPVVASYLFSKQKAKKSA